MKKTNYKNMQFFQSALLNSNTYFDYLNRLKKIAMFRFEWVNLPTSMNERFIEESLFYMGQCAFLYDKNYGFINTNCSSSGKINIYNLPTVLNCYSNEYNTMRKLYTGLINISEDRRKYLEDKQAILVMNDWDRIPTLSTIELFAYRLTESEMTAFTNIKAQKTPILLLTDNNQLFSMQQVYNKYDGNQPVIFGDKDQLARDTLQVFKTDAPFVADKIIDYKKEIWNEALTFLRH